jgi:hypothetical protein
MLAVIALICFVLALFHAHLGSIDFVVLGLAFVAAHLAFAGWTAWGPWRGRQNQ